MTCCCFSSSSETSQDDAGSRPPKSTTSKSKSKSKSRKSVITTQPTRSYGSELLTKNQEKDLPPPRPKSDPIGQKIISALFSKQGQTNHLFSFLEIEIDELKAHLPPDDPDLLTSQGILAQEFLYVGGRYMDALKLIEKLVEPYQKVFGLKDNKTITIQLLYGYALLDLGRPEQGLKVFQDISELTLITKVSTSTSSPSSGSSSSDTEINDLTQSPSPSASSSSNSTLNSSNDSRHFEKVMGKLNSVAQLGVASSLKKLGGSQRLDEALEILDGVFMMRKSLFGHQSSEAILVQFMMAKVMKKQGKIEESNILAQKTFRELFDCHPKMVEDDLQKLQLEHFIATLYRDHKSSETGFRLLLETFQKEVRVLGPDHPLTLSTLMNFGILFERVDKLHMAATCYKGVCLKRNLILGQQHPKSIKTKERMDSLMKAPKKYDVQIHVIRGQNGQLHSYAERTYHKKNKV